MRGDKNWTRVNEIEHWAWEAYRAARDAWLSSLPDDCDAHYADDAEQATMFIEAHPGGWPSHPDQPTDF